MCAYSFFAEIHFLTIALTVILLLPPSVLLVSGDRGRSVFCVVNSWVRSLTELRSGQMGEHVSARGVELQTCE